LVVQIIGGGFSRGSHGRRFPHHDFPFRVRSENVDSCVFAYTLFRDGIGDKVRLIFQIRRFYVMYEHIGGVVAAGIAGFRLAFRLYVRGSFGKEGFVFSFPFYIGIQFIVIIGAHV
jgi:hypothetical protein